MNEEDKQAVTDAEPTDQSVADAQDARDDEPTMDDLLDELEGQQDALPQEDRPAVQPTPEPQDTGLSNRLAKVEQDNKDREKAAISKDIEVGMTETVARFLENETISKIYDKDEIEGLIQFEASKNTNLGIAFGLRHSKPAEWRKIEAGLMKKIEVRAAGKVSQSNEDREAAEDAVRGVSTVPPVTESNVPSQSDLAGLSGKELSDLKRTLDPDFGA